MWKIREEWDLKVLFPLPLSHTLLVSLCIASNLFLLHGGQAQLWAAFFFEPLDGSENLLESISRVFLYNLQEFSLK